MILQVSANAGQRVHHLNAMGLNFIGWPYATAQENLRRIECACAKDNFFARAEGCSLTLNHHIDGCGPPTRKTDAIHTGMRNDGEVGSLFHGV